MMQIKLKYATAGDRQTLTPQTKVMQKHLCVVSCTCAAGKKKKQSANNHIRNPHVGLFDVPHKQRKKKQRAALQPNRFSASACGVTLVDSTN